MEKIMNKSSKDASRLGHSTFEDRTLDDQRHDDTHAGIACDMLNPAQCPEHALMARIPLGLGPSLHQLRSRSLCLVRRLHSY
jgi:hypothetical protein